METSAKMPNLNHAPEWMISLLRNSTLLFLFLRFQNALPAAVHRDLIA